MDPVLIAALVLLAIAIAFVIQRVVVVHRRQATTGREELIGKTAVTRTPLSPEGQVFFRGERWEAVSESGNIAENVTVIIIKVEDLILHVKKPETK